MDDKDVGIRKSEFGQKSIICRMLILYIVCSPVFTIYYTIRGNE